LSILTAYRAKRVGVALGVMAPILLLGVAFSHAFGIHLWILNVKEAPGGSQDTPIILSVSFLMATIGFGIYVSSEWAKRNPPPEG
jgi:type IV secretory pathway TrbD component